MTKKEKFIQFVQENCFDKIGDIDPDVVTYWEEFQKVKEKKKPILTDNGKIVLRYLQQHPEIGAAPARDIAEELFISSRTVSGSMRKLVTDGFVEKIGEDPTTYSITDLGKNLQIEN